MTLHVSSATATAPGTHARSAMFSTPSSGPQEPSKGRPLGGGAAAADHCNHCGTRMGQHPRFATVAQCPHCWGCATKVDGKVYPEIRSAR